MAEAPAVGPDLRRLLLLGGVVLVIIFAVLFFFFRGCVPAMKGAGDYLTIYSNLGLKDAANVVARLKELKITYQIKDDGRSVAVPKDKADLARLGLAEKNLPAGGVVGWEIFDETKLGATDFDRRIQLIRALSGELSRTIRRIEAVEDARVQIVLPETKLFAVEAAPVTASVLLRLRPGLDLSTEKINGIVHLVASSVENLRPENVTVIDDTGRILTANITKLNMVEQTPALEEKIVEQIEKAGALVKVTEVIEVAQVAEITPEAVTISPEMTAASPEVTASSTTRELTAEEKILLKVQAKKELENNLAGKAQEILNRFYPLNSVIVKVTADLKNGLERDSGTQPALQIDKLNAVILVDNRVELTPTLKDSTFASVAAALGYNQKRGDRLLLQKVPFHLAEPLPEIMGVQVKQNLPANVTAKAALGSFKGTRYLWWVAGGVILLLIIFLVVRRLWAVSGPIAVATAASAPAAPRRDPTLDNIKSAAERNPERMAELLRTWLAE